MVGQRLVVDGEQPEVRTGRRPTVTPLVRPEGQGQAMTSAAWSGGRLRVSVESAAIRFAIESGDRVELSVRGKPVVVVAGEESRLALDGPGPRLNGTPTMVDVEGTLHADGTFFTSSIPTPSPEDAGDVALDGA